MDIKLKDQEIIDIISGDLDETRDYVEELSQLRSDDMRRLRGKPYTGDSERKGKGHSTTVSKVIQNTVNWTMPGLVEIFSGDFFRFSLDNSRFSEDLKAYVRKIWFREQDGEVGIYDFLHTALTSRSGGIFKTYHDEQYDLETEKFDGVTEEQFQKLEANPKNTVSSYERIEETSNGMSSVYYDNVKVSRRNMVFQGPRIKVVKPEDFGISPEAGGNVDIARLVYHRQVRNLDYVRRMENAGVFKKGSLKRIQNESTTTDELTAAVDEEANDRYYIDNIDAPESVNNPESNDSPIKELEPNNQFYLYEVYTKLDIDGDGLLEPVIISMSGNIIFSIQENPYKRPPFRVGKPFRVPFQEQHQTPGVLLEDEQKTMTNLTRMMQDSAAFSTYRNTITSDKQTYESLKRRGPNSVIYGNPDDVKDISPPDANQYILKAIEMAQGDYENISGVTRYNQGLDANSLNKTFGGMNLIMSASQQRQKLSARVLGWTFRNVIYDIVKCLEIYPTQEYIQILEQNQIKNKKVELSDISVDVGISFQERFAVSGQLDQLGQWQVQVGKQLGIVSDEQILSTKRKQYELLDINTEGMLPSDEEYREQKVAQPSPAGPGQSTPPGAGGIQPPPQNVQG